MQSTTDINSSLSTRSFLQQRTTPQQTRPSTGRRLSLLPMVRKWLTSGSMIFTMLAVPIMLHAAPVSVSNYPLYLLSNEVTKGAPSAKRLLEPGDVGHHGSLSPSDMKSIQDSKYVVWFGEPLERNLAQTLTQAPNAIALLDFKAFVRHPMRDVEGQAIKGTIDPHIWLDPENAKAITRALAVIHSHADPQHAKLYQANTQAFAQRMDAAVQAVKDQHSAMSNQASPYWAYHDAYQYLESAAAIKLAGTLTTDHHLPPKASQFRWLQQHRPSTSMCLVSQGEVSSGIRKKLAPVSVTTQIEDMSQATDFVSGWQQIATDINRCISG
ncbi:metal ABC transporter substrate-binding protein [Psychrobacter pygoscelis]|uniref:metal ABC transporter substrate-binding protein n=1 Tax=Psychrobacter pygoscelis TaxID=2488563 RepID=UPI001F62502A|nr:metal ABC transporter substrate-binding protein [Psychrobacter pygoscelis]